MSRRRPRLAAVRLTDAEHEHLRAAARKNGLSVSAYLRRLATNDTWSGMTITIWIPAPSPAMIGAASWTEVVRFVDTVVEKAMTYEPRTGWDPHVSTEERP